MNVNNITAQNNHIKRLCIIFIFLYYYCSYYHLNLFHELISEYNKNKYIIYRRETTFRPVPSFEHHILYIYYTHATFLIISLKFTISKINTITISVILYI